MFDDDFVASNALLIRLRLTVSLPQLLHCLDKLEKLPTNVKCLQETRVVRTVNNLRKYEGEVGNKATELVAKWKREIVVANADSSNGKDKRLYPSDTENVKPGTRNNNISSQRNDAHSTPNSDSRDQTVDKILTVSCSPSDSSKSSCSGRKSSTNCDGKMFESNQSSSSLSRSSAKRKGDNSVRSECDRKRAKKSKRESDVIDIDCTMGASFADALGMLDVLSTSKAKKLSNDKSSIIGIRSSIDDTPILLTKRPQGLQLPLDIAVDILPSSTATEAETLQRGAFRQPKQLTDDVTTNIISRTTKTKVFSGNNVGTKCKKVPSLFETCIKILQENIDCEY